MMPGVIEAIRQLEVIATGRGSLTKLRDWWLSTADGSESIDFLLDNSRAARDVERGLIECGRLFPKHPGVVDRYVRFACACAAGQNVVADFGLPIWLSWIEQTAQAFRSWSALLSRLPDAQAVNEFRATSWTLGIKQIRFGRPRVAARIWADTAQRIRASAEARIVGLTSARAELTRVARLASDMNWPAPPADGAQDRGVCSSQIDHWWSAVAEPAIDRLFWSAHQLFLHQAKNNCYRELAPKEKRALAGLIDSANLGEHPTFNDVCKLSEWLLDAAEQRLARDFANRRE